MSDLWDRFGGERWRIVSPHLDRALELTGDQRDVWLASLRAEDAALAADVEALLDEHSVLEQEGFLAGGSPSRPTPASLAGQTIGAYTLRSLIGQGGMGSVWLAERSDGRFQGVAAVKLLNASLVGQEGEARFRREGSILARLRHPHIAHLIDAGLSPAGQPYLILEHVDGERIDHYCDARRLGIDARLRLFLDVLAAVARAHANLIVHRDLKPSNVLVGRDGEVKLLDFGVAKLLERDAGAADVPALTREGQAALTPEYAAPEQLTGGDVTTVTDVYALGVLLYILLTGRHPTGAHTGSAAGLIRAIVDTEAPRLSDAVVATSPPIGEAPADTAANRSTTPGRLRRVLQGDLDNIVAKALKKSAPERYTSVEALADDLRRHLTHEPVSARADSLAYRAAKFVRRNRTAVALATLASAALAAGLVGTLSQARQARAQAARADQETQRARSEAQTAAYVSDFLTSLFRAADPRMTNPDITARELLERGAARIDTELARQPQVQGRMMNVIGDVFTEFELNDKAQPLLDRALAQNRQLFGENSTEVADTKAALARLARNRGDYGRARQLYEEALATRDRTVGPQPASMADTLMGLAATFVRLGEPKQAIASYERATDIYKASVGENDARTLGSLAGLAFALHEAGESARARALLEQLVPRIERSLGPEHPYLAKTLSDLAIVKRSLADYEGVEALLRRSIAINERLYGPDYSAVGTELTALANFLNSVGRFRDALPVYQRAIAAHRRARGPNHSFEADAQVGLGRGFRARHDYPSALSHYKRAVEIYRAALGTSHWRYANGLSMLGDLQMEMGALRLAAPSLRDAVSIIRRATPDNRRNIADTLVPYGVLLARTGRPVEAEAALREAMAGYEEALPRNHYLRAAATSALGECLLLQGRVAEAEPLLIEGDKQLQGRLDHHRRSSLKRLVRLYDAKRDAGAARRYRAELAAFESKALVQ